MRKSYLFSLVAVLSLALVSMGLSNSAIAQERGLEPTGEVSEMGGGGGATLLVIGSLVAIILVAVAVGGGGGEEPPVSP